MTCSLIEHGIVNIAKKRLFMNIIESNSVHSENSVVQPCCHPGVSIPSTYDGVVPTGGSAGGGGGGGSSPPTTVQSTVQK